MAKRQTTKRLHDLSKEDKLVRAPDKVTRRKAVFETDETALRAFAAQLPAHAEVLLLQAYGLTAEA